MSSAARSVYVFGIYLLALGGVLIGAPNTLLALLRLPPTTEPWIHALGVVVMVVGMLDVACARAEQTAYFRATVGTRIFVVVAFVLLAFMKIVPWIVASFGIVDLAGALWTLTALRGSMRAEVA